MHVVDKSWQWLHGIYLIKGKWFQPEIQCRGVRVCGPNTPCDIVSNGRSFDPSRRSKVDVKGENLNGWILSAYKQGTDMAERLVPRARDMGICYKQQPASLCRFREQWQKC